jgi:hypothetical protein
VSDDLNGTERNTNVGHVGDFALYRPTPYVTRDVIGVTGRLRR